MSWGQVVGQNTIDAGTQASGGIGRNISKGGKKISRKYLLTAKRRPKGIPISCAIRKPAKTRPVLMYQLSQYPGKKNTSRQASSTSVGGGTLPIQGTLTGTIFPVFSSIMPKCSVSMGKYLDKISQRTTKLNSAIKPLQKVALDRSSGSFLRERAIIWFP